MDLLTKSEQVAKEKHDAATKLQLEAGNKRVFERECQAAGIDPANGVSPSLLKIIMTAG